MGAAPSWGTGMGRDPSCREFCTSRGLHEGNFQIFPAGLDGQVGSVLPESARAWERTELGLGWGAGSGWGLWD